MIRAGIAAILIVLIGAPAFAQGQLTQDDVDEARRRRTATAQELLDVTAQYQNAYGEEIRLREQVQTLALDIALKERELATLRAEAQEIVRSMYMDGGNPVLVGLFDATVFVEVPMRASYLDFTTEQDVRTLNRLQAAEEAYIAQQAELDVALAEQERLVAEIEVAAAQIGEQLAAADAEYASIAAEFQRQEEERRRREEEERRRREEEEQRRREAAAAAAAAAATTTTTTAAPTEQTTTTTTAPPTQETTTTTAAPTEETTTTTTTTQPPPPVVTSGRTCPVNAATSFSDSWGAPRSGGRTHKGVDMIAARGAPIVAIESGYIERLSNSSLGGLSVYFRGNSGDRYYYAHLDFFADGIGSGTRLDVGGLLGGNGSTGNAPDWLPHLHFQWAPAGSDWVNPYPLVYELCY